MHTVCNGRFEIVECDVAPDAKAVGRPLKDISRRGEYLVLLVRPAAGEGFSLPHGDTLIGAGDHVVLAMRGGDMDVVRLFGGMA